MQTIRIVFYLLHFLRLRAIVVVAVVVLKTAHTNFGEFGQLEPLVRELVKVVMAKYWNTPALPL